MLQEYWLLLPQRLELVNLSVQHGVCNRQSADYGFTPVPHFFVFDRDSSFLSNTLWFYLTEGLPLHPSSTCRAVCILEYNGWWLEIAVEFGFYSASSKTNFFLSSGSSQIQVKAAFKLDEVDADISSHQPPSLLDAITG